MKVNISGVVAENRTPISIVGSSLGTQFFQIESREAFPKFAEKKREVEMAGNVELIVNRSPLRYRMVGKDILNISIEENLAGQPVLVINKHKDNDIESDVTIPISSNTTAYSEFSRDAIGQALKGDKSKIFADPEKLAHILNDLNREEISRIEATISFLEKAKQGCIGAMSENTKKASDYKNEIIGSQNIKQENSTREGGVDGLVVNIHED